MTLSNFYRDYLYIPLGGNRAGAGRAYFNLLVVFILCGLWHGANWTFLAWGLYHGGLLVFERATGIRSVEPKRGEAARRGVTFVLVLVGWALFRSGSLGDAALFLKAMFVPIDLPLPVEVSLALNARNIIFLALSSIVLFLPREFSLLKIFDEKRPALSLALTAGLFVLALYSFSFIAGGSFNPFIYFRF